MSLLGKNKPYDAEKDEQYTPLWLFEKLNTTFDLDVASPVDQRTHVPALKKLTKSDDGLTAEWNGFVFMNPPYSKAKLWVEKFIKHNNGIALLPFSKAYWMVDLWNESSAICPVYDIKFELKTGKTQGIFMPVALFAMGQKAAYILLEANINKVR